MFLEHLFFEHSVLCSSQVTSTCNQLICSCTLAEMEKTGESKLVVLVLFWGGDEIPTLFGGDEILRWRVPYGIFVSVGNLEQEGVSKYTFGWINLQLISKMFCRNKEMQNDPVPFTSTNFKIPWVVFVPWSRFAGAWNYDLSWFQYNSRVFRDAATNTPKHCGCWTLKSSNWKIPVGGQ